MAPPALATAAPSRDWSLPHAYIINLVRRPDRREQARETLLRVGWPPSRITVVPAVDAHDENEKVTLAGGRKVLLSTVLRHDPFMVGALACTMSHVKALSMALGGNTHPSDTPFAIFEDDIKWQATGAQIRRTIGRTVNATGGWNVTLLGCDHPDSNVLVERHDPCPWRIGAAESQSSACPRWRCGCELHGEVNLGKHAVFAKYGNAYFGQAGHWRGKGMPAAPRPAVWSQVPHMKCEQTTAYMVKRSYAAKLRKLWRRSIAEVVFTGAIYNITPSLAADQVWKKLQRAGEGWYVARPLLAEQDRKGLGSDILTNAPTLLTNSGVGKGQASSWDVSAHKLRRPVRPRPMSSVLKGWNASFLVVGAQKSGTTALRSTINTALNS